MPSKSSKSKSKSLTTLLARSLDRAQSSRESSPTQSKPSPPPNGLKEILNQNKKRSSQKGTRDIKESRYLTINQIKKSLLNKKKSKMQSSSPSSSTGSSKADGRVSPPPGSTLPNGQNSSMNDHEGQPLKVVIMYALEGCPYCDKARKLLTNFKIPFSDFVAKSDDYETKNRYKEMTELDTFPMIYIKNCDDPAKYAQIGGYTDLVRYIMTLQELQESDIDIVALKGLHDILSKPRS